MSKSPSTLYVIGQKAGGGNFKIGRTANSLDDRMRRLQTGNPHELYLAVIGRGLGWMERSLHRAFEQDRLSGEWFCRGGPTEVFVDHLWATVRGTPVIAADVFHAAVVALAQPEKAERARRELWDSLRYHEVASRYETLAADLSGRADTLRREAQLRFDPDRDLPSIADSIERRTVDDPEAA